jgi:hypothetical protein
MGIEVQHAGIPTIDLIDVGGMCFCSAQQQRLRPGLLRKVGGRNEVSLGVAGLILAEIRQLL